MSKVEYFVVLIPECGTIVITNRLILIGTTVDIRFNPSTILHVKTEIESGRYRWVYRNKTSLDVIFRKEEAEKYDDRLDETSYTLHIENVQERDEGRYLVQCSYRARNGTEINPFTNSVDLKLQKNNFITKTTVNSRTPSKGIAIANIYK